jgi:predicted TIM-barrel fold metal-dependent hydrolase
MNRRNCLASLAGIATTAQAQQKAEMKKPAPAKTRLPLEEFEPKSMLHVPETRVPRSRFPVIDVHTHLSFSTSLESTLSGKEEKASFPATPEELLQVMDRRNIRTMVNLTGGYGKTLAQVLDYFKPHSNRFLVFTEPTWVKAADPGYPKLQADELERARKAGARGLKILKTLGLYLREQIVKGPLVKLDDKRFDPMWEAAGALKMPVAIHTSDPEAFFLPIDRFNERWEELHAHPDWSFHDKDFPSNAELMEARNRVVERHPRTQFLVLHVGDSENLAWVSEWLDRYPNMHVETGARIGELGRQPRTARKFFDKYQDRILFGTDAIPHGDQYPQQVFGDALYEIYYRFLETEDEYFDYAPARIPPQGRWRIYGLGLPETILRKLYHQNAVRLLGVKI